PFGPQKKNHQLSWWVSLFWFAGRMCMRTGGASEIETEVEGTGSLLFKESYDEAVHKNPYEI
ncbi:hypothetical protein, partial [uncultured Dialister sp.]|uniref:hypothetical protein n=1 Tax=uncultured Dialister sp. TaxID=278064 RepID=UPI0026DB8F4A